MDNGNVSLWERELQRYNLASDLRIQDPVFEVTLKSRILSDVLFLEGRYGCIDGVFPGWKNSRPGVWAVLINDGRFHVQGAEFKHVFEAGDICLFNGLDAKPLSYSSEGPTDVKIVYIPSEVYRSRLPDSMRIIRSHNQGVGAILADHIRSVFRQMHSMPDAAMNALVFPTAELISSVFAVENGATTDSQVKVSIESVKRYIGKNIKQADLSPETISREFDVSKRYLHMLFQQENVSISEWIKSYRLESCKNALTNEAFKDQTITDLTYEWGFTDPSHFSRVFKAYTGYSPRVYRQRFLKSS